MKRGPFRSVLVSACILFGMQANAQTVTTVKEILPNAALFYDYDADGNKEFFLSPVGWYTVFKGDTLWDKYLFLTESYPGAFDKKEIILTGEFAPFFLFEDLNNDGIIDLSGINNGYYNSNNTIRTITTLCSNGNGYSVLRDRLALPGCDLNSDGRIDMLSFGMRHVKDGAILDGPAADGTGEIISSKKYINYRLPDGNYKTEQMVILTQDEYESCFDPESWYSPTAWNGLISPGGRSFNAASAGLGAVSLARAPMRIDTKVSSALRSATANAPLKAQGMGTYIPTPSKAIDLNADGLVDLVDEKNGIIYFNTGDGRWIINEIGGQVITADFNGDDIQDYIFPGENLELLVYTGAGEFNKQTLYRNFEVDKDVYCYDFDHDGDVDILVTFSAPLNQTEYAYTMFFTNDGSGNFTQKDEQDYGDLKLYFGNCQDIDGDGYMDMLAFNCYIPEYYQYKTYNWDIEDYVVEKRTVEESWYVDGSVYFLKGKPDLTFSDPVRLFDVFEPHWEELQDEDSREDINYFYGIRTEDMNDYKLNAEDIDNDGKIEIWLSRSLDDEDGYGIEMNRYYNVENGVTNTAPQAPEKPSVIYDNGWLMVNWDAGHDAQTQTIDLTYALRIGTTPGGDDILRANATSDGMRRNFLEGNMLKRHNYSIDLTTYPPMDIYVAVQAIDAQHTGSAWSQEATVKHNTLPVSFVADKERMNLNDTVTVLFTPLPDGFTHEWKVEGGSIVASENSSLRMCFDKPGLNSITHILTGPNANSAQYVVNVSVNDVRPDEVKASDWNTMNIFRYLRIDQVADYNYDGYHDIVYDNVFMKGTDNLSFSKAAGVWNTGLDISGGLWYDWDRNGSADYLFSGGDSYYYLPHNGTGNLTPKQSDDKLKYLIGGLWRDLDDDDYYEEQASRIPVDMLHDGNYSLLGHKWPRYSDENPVLYYLYTRNIDGDYEASVLLGENVELVRTWDENRGDGTLTVDFNHDGYVDLVALGDDDLEVISKIVFFYNNGSRGFERVEVPLEQKMAHKDMEYNNMFYNMTISFVDFNNDGYYDIFAWRSTDNAPYIMWNNSNRSFSAPYVLSIGNLEYFSSNPSYQIADYNNDGYLDIISLQQNSSVEAPGLYAFFMGADGVTDQGFVYPKVVSPVNNDYNFFKQFNSKWITFWNNVRDIYEYQYLLPGNDNEKPSAPTGVRAVQTADGMLIEWDGAKDDHTPAVQMRYNLSVKHKGKTGAGAFVISPQNGLNANAAYLPGYEYIAATRYEVPISALTVGEYEIQIQAIDLLNEMSEFSAPVTVSIDRQVIEAPTLVSIGKDAIITYMGESTSGNSAWDFDGGTVVSGNGFGPYHVSWNTGGVKTIKLTMNGKTYERMIAVDVNDAQVTLPRYLFEGYTSTVDIPDGMTAKWKRTDGQDWDDDIYASGNMITVSEGASCGSLGLQLTLTNANGTSKTFNQEVEILGTDQIPYITLIGADASGHNVIGFDADADYFPQVVILKETNVYNQFTELARVPATDGTYTDLASDLGVKTERYAVVGVMADGLLSPRSDVHMSVHMTINRGLQDNSYNLIWNKYEGAVVQTYNILRGSSQSALTQIASVSGASTSYTDVAADAGQPYYAIEYVLSNSAPGSAQRQTVAYAPSRGGLTGRSNTVNTGTAFKATYVERLSILSSNNSYTLSDAKPAIYLYAEILPVTATYQSVTWEIISGDDLATIDHGLLVARNPHSGGTVTVKATAVDGSGVSATIQIQVEASKFTVSFVDWDGTVLQQSEMEYGTVPEYKGAEPVRESTDDYNYSFTGWSPEISVVTGNTIYTATYNQTETVVPYIDAYKTKPNRAVKYIDEKGNLFLILPDNRKFNIMGVEIK